MLPSTVPPSYQQLIDEKLINNDTGLQLSTTEFNSC